MKELEIREIRRRDLDIIREWIIACLVLFHTARIFDDLGGFYIKSKVSHWSFNIMNMAALQVGMPLAFVIAGYGIYNSLHKRSSKSFIMERTKRLAIPFIFGMLVIIPPQVFYQMKVDPDYLESYWQYYTKFFDVVPVWNFPWFLDAAPGTWYFHRGNAWFLYELFVFSILCLPLFINMTKDNGIRTYRWLENTNRTLVGTVLLGLPMGISEALLKTDPAGGWGKVSYIPFLIYGFILANYPEFRVNLKKNCKKLIVASIITFFLGAYSYFKLSYNVDPLIDYSLGSLLFRGIKGINGWLMVATIWSFIEIRKARVEKKGIELSESLSKLEKYAHKAVLPFYLLHETILVIVGFYVVNWSVNIFLQYLIICLITYVITLSLYEFFIRRSKIVGFLFGMKER